MPSSRRIVLKVDKAPGYFGRVVVDDNGSVMELTWSWSRILMTSRGAMQNLDFIVLDDRIVGLIKGTYLDTSPAIAPAITTCRFEPWM